MTALEKRIWQAESRIAEEGYEQDAADLRALLAAHKQAKRELALIRKLARMSGVDKNWWKVGGVKL